MKSLCIILLSMALLFIGLPRAEEFTGTHTLAMEHFGFQADGKEEVWHVTGAASRAFNRASFTLLADGKLFMQGESRATVKGYLSQPGRYGHLGMYCRQLYVTKIIHIESQTNPLFRKEN